MPSVNNQTTLQFLGATETVTGSRYLIEANGQRILVDCGLFQGYKKLRDRNWAPFPVDPKSIDVLLLTHAHLDHSGYIPALIKQGFNGRVHCTHATAELCGLLLPDSGHLLEEFARYAKRKGFSKHQDPLPLYTEEDAVSSLEYFDRHDFNHSFAIGDDISVEFHPAGHILGAAQIHLSINGHRVHFTGDLGREKDSLMRGPAPLSPTDVLITESTYGNRTHPDADAEEELAPVIKRVAARGGVIIIPAFAVGRSQGIMLHIARLRQRGEIPRVPVFLNSPMAINATDIYHRYHDEHHVSTDECRDMYELATMVHTAEESKQLNLSKGPMIIISASGMLSGGRVLHHIEAFGQDSRNVIMLAGYQAGGTRGAALVAGAKFLRLFGRDIPIRAEIVDMQSFSGHADSNELMSWLGATSAPPKMTFITHGDVDASDALRARIKRELGWNCRVPEHLERVVLFEGHKK